MSDQVLSGLIAVILGGVVGGVLFVPFVAFAYRRYGRLTLRQFLTWGGALVYFWAIWTYTLLPLPASDTYRCVGQNLDPLTIVTDVQDALASGSLTHPGIMQLVLNVVLFMPLGAFLRILAGRGVVVALFAGLAVSLLIEFTQLTGVWGLYPCAYRLFDVVDLMTNTTGAVLGSLAVKGLPARLRDLRDSTASIDAPRPVTKVRRMIGALCDVIGANLLALAAAGVYQVSVAAFAGLDATDPTGTTAGIAGNLVAIALMLAVILATGRSVGDIAVRIHYRDGGLPEPLARIGRALGGIVGLTAVSLLPVVGDSAFDLLAVVAIGATLFTRRGRGLPGWLTGRDPVDSRAERPIVMTAAANPRPPRA